MTDKYANEKLTISCDCEELESDKRSSTSFHRMNEYELLGMLRETKSLHDHADILHYLYETK